MGTRSDYEEVKEYISEHGDNLVSDAYINNKTLLDIDCGSCGKQYRQTFDRFKRGYKHPRCPDKAVSTKNKEATKICVSCSKEFVIIGTKDEIRRKICSNECKNAYYMTRKENGYYETIGKKGGMKSVYSQSRRSKNEIHFAELCIQKFGVNAVVCNEQIFNGWDADIILTKLSIAISWNGIWHYKQVRNGHNVEKVQNRDLVKDQNIKKCGYMHVVIADMGGENKKFVESKFNEVLNIIYFL